MADRTNPRAIVDRRTASADEWSRIADDYHLLSEPFTRQYAEAALDLLMPVGPDTTIIEVAAGTGAFSVAAARTGARIVATDVAPAMVSFLDQVLAPYPQSSAAVMNGQELAVPDDAYDIGVSIFGVMLFPDWRAGLSELARVVRPGGRVCVATWVSPIGSGPIIPFTRAFRAALPEAEFPSLGEGLAALSSAANLEREMAAAGLDGIEVHRVRGHWRAESLDWVIANLDRIFGGLSAFADLDSAQRVRLEPALRDAFGAYVGEDGSLSVASDANVSVARA